MSAEKTGRKIIIYKRCINIIKDWDYFPFDWQDYNGTAVGGIGSFHLN
jgi:hypothetical protein